MKLQVILLLFFCVNMAMNKRIMVGGNCKNECLLRFLACDDRCRRVFSAESGCSQLCHGTLAECLDKPCARFAENYYQRYR
ncbi:unnamed protein product [Heterobilharzia americana]|nr:unnamed protein product [Heterobilharzia americana]